ncbi:hypothetical protein [Streptomyces sp. NBC_00162]|uniref:hypothetical protein n=1 Tax=Streptomyces sp. NBC_00162 TaxID=2903629 RepID=UPI00214B4BD4|nr:hypothetical protein [Streptomyces sp. NBC_00162]UUU37455.1 hypothetical protein JIW86_00005 [Streptomyces sp. NBC_00162]
MKLEFAAERERARLERQLGQARERLGRVQVQQEKAKRRRLTAEEQQEFWLTEALTAQEEINRLETEARDLVVAEGALEPVRTDDVDDSDFETRLESITVEGLEDEALIEAGLPSEAVTDVVDASFVAGLVAGVLVQPLSNPALDKLPISADAQRQDLLTSVAPTVHRTDPARPAPALEKDEASPYEPLPGMVRIYRGRNV